MYMKNKKWCKILNHSQPWSYILLFTVVLLMIVYSYKIGQMTFDATFKESFETFWNWIDPVAGIMTFLTTLAIFWFQAKQKWENSLEKQLTVDYYYTGLESPLLSVQNAYLAGEGDIRAWAQALGRQVMGDLEFDMNWDDPKPKISFDPKQNQHIKLYKVKLYLSSNPLNNEVTKAKAEGFLLKNFKHSVIEKDENIGTIIWRRE